MKILKSILFGVMAMATLGGFTSCQDDVDAPEVQVPVATKKANTTIFDFKKEYWEDATNYCKKVGTKEDGSHIIVAGRVITSDEGGNIFKSITIQDETAALAFSVNTYNLFLDYRIGQEIVVDLTDMYVGKYNGLQQMGWPEEYQGSYEATFMAPEFFRDHIELNGMPEPDKIIVHNLNSISDIPSGVDGLCAWQSQLIHCNNVKFVPKTNANTGEIVTTFGVYKTNMNQGVEIGGAEVTMRVSGYADFVNEQMPTEACDATFVLSYFGTGWQVMLMDTSDITNVGDPTMPLGSETNPYTVPQAIAQIAVGNTKTVWTQGYIVGTVAPDVTTVTSNADIEWGTSPALASTVVIAPTADCQDYSKCIIVPLPTGSTMREYVALREHPENLGKLLNVQGVLTANYLGTYGVADNRGTSYEFRLEGVDVPDDPDKPVTGDGDGSEANPYTTQQIIAMNPQSTTEAVAKGVWVTGYIVGYYKDYNPHFTADGANYSNVLISTNPAASTKEECVCVQLVANTDPRAALNLGDNPGMLGSKVSVYGDIMKYNTLPGVKNTSNYKVDGGGDKPNPDTPGDGTGAENSPYNCGQVIAMNPQSTTEASAKGVWVAGYIVGYYKDYNPHFTADGAQAANILMSDDPNASSKEQCISVQLVSKSDTRAALNLLDNPGNLGKKVQVFGDVMKYNTLPGVKNTSNYKIDGTGGGDKPNPDTPTGNAIFEETFATSQGDFTIDNISLSEGLTYVWKWDTYKYMKASAYVGGASHASDSRLISPAIAIPAGANAVLTFDHVCNKFPSLDVAKEQVSLEVSTDNGATWSKLTIPTYSTNSNWTFVNSGNISLAAYAGKTIKIAFHYTSTDAASGSWEVRNVKIAK